MADVLKKQGSRRDEIEEIMRDNCFRNALDKNNCMRCKELERLKLKT